MAALTLPSNIWTFRLRTGQQYRLDERTALRGPEPCLKEVINNKF